MDFSPFKFSQYPPSERAETNDVAAMAAAEGAAMNDLQKNTTYQAFGEPQTRSKYGREMRRNEA
jgi:hypothetical protein